MKRVFMAVAVLAVIAASSAIALFQQTQPDEYASVDELIADLKAKEQELQQRFEVEGNVIAVFYDAKNKAHSFWDIRAKGKTYILKECVDLCRGEKAALSYMVKYSKKSIAEVLVAPDAAGTLQYSIHLTEK